jgi:hypothetical protein
MTPDEAVNKACTEAYAYLERDTSGSFTSFDTAVEIAADVLQKYLESNPAVSKSDLTTAASKLEEIAPASRKGIEKALTYVKG